jgi:hypothetical protein
MLMSLSVSYGWCNGQKIKTFWLYIPQNVHQFQGLFPATCSTPIKISIGQSNIYFSLWTIIQNFPLEYDFLAFFNMFTATAFIPVLLIISVIHFWYLHSSWSDSVNPATEPRRLISAVSILSFFAVVVLIHMKKSILLSFYMILFEFP